MSVEAHVFHNAAKSRFDKLSLKKSKKKPATERKPEKAIPTIILDESSDNLKSFISKKRGDYKYLSYSPIVIDDSFEVQKVCFKSPGPVKVTQNLTPEMGHIDLSITPENRRGSLNFAKQLRPSAEGWSPSQDIICVSPKLTTPTRSRDIANESMEECSIKEIHESHTNILDELYGDAWKSIPTLFKKKSAKTHENLSGVTKKLDFLDDSDKENSEVFDSNVRKFYEDADGLATPKTNAKTDAKTKKKLYTAKELDTPDIRRIKKELLTFTEPKPKKKPMPEKIQQSDRKIKKVAEPEESLDVKRLSFMGSLADNIPSWRCHPEALDFKKNYKSKRDQLTRRLFADFNRLVFDNRLEDDMPIVWDTKLRSTAGTATNRTVITSNHVKIRTSSIKLSSKVIDGPQRLRDTLIHEMCHSATWIIDHEIKAGHGPLWKKWAKRALRAIPELEQISRCHDLEIHFKYSYKCTRCGYTVNRHSKSIDMTKKCCGYCRGTFELVVNKKTKDGVVMSTPARKIEVNDFALYVKQNYASLKDGNRTHAQVMKMLGENYSERKKKV